MGQGAPRRDAMLTRTAWTPDRLDAAKNEPSRAEYRVSAPAIAPGGNGIGIGAVVAGPRRHTIAQGESLASIARLYYGSGRYAEPLGQFNRGRIARGGLRPGDLLVIPAREELDSTGGWAVPPRPRVAAGPGPSRPADESGDSRLRPDSSVTAWGEPPSMRRLVASARRPRAITHVVGPHETPRSIARDRLGDARRAQEIIDLNHDLLATEGRWTPGLRILLPPDAGPPARGTLSGSTRSPGGLTVTSRRTERAGLVESRGASRLCCVERHPRRTGHPRVARSRVAAGTSEDARPCSTPVLDGPSRYLPFSRGWPRRRQLLRTRRMGGWCSSGSRPSPRSSRPRGSPSTAAAASSSSRAIPTSRPATIAAPAPTASASSRIAMATAGRKPRGSSSKARSGR